MRQTTILMLNSQWDKGFSVNNPSNKYHELLLFYVFI